MEEEMIRLAFMVMGAKLGNIVADFLLGKEKADDVSEDKEDTSEDTRSETTDNTRKESELGEMPTEFITATNANGHLSSEFYTIFTGSKHRSNTDGISHQATENEETSSTTR